MGGITAAHKEGSSRAYLGGLLASPVMGPATASEPPRHPTSSAFMFKGLTTGITFLRVRSCCSLFRQTAGLPLHNNREELIKVRHRDADR